MLPGKNIHFRIFNSARLGKSNHFLYSLSYSRQQGASSLSQGTMQWTHCMRLYIIIHTHTTQNMALDKGEETWRKLLKYRENMQLPCTYNRCRYNTSSICIHNGFFQVLQIHTYCKIQCSKVLCYYNSWEMLQEQRYIVTLQLTNTPAITSNVAEPQQEGMHLCSKQVVCTGGLLAFH